ncbi:juvenile hormone esterase-like [Euwallacea fornicatus]|uniref:juvenile hormone esterase-like n=1 Tax=Euwallacea fornicatus TaxID=995702 RepID=UPI00338D444E
MSGLTVKVKQGSIRGTTGTNLDGDTFYKFLGIPYAKPPVGPLRFKAPQPAESWEGTRDCTHDGNQCVQKIFGIKTIGSEDCLYLNVHVKDLSTKAKPVMVFIHGGAFIMGNGTQEMCGPEYLMTQDIVLVTLNYRLGLFGFLSLEDTSLEVPGNAGLKDQALGLKWVHENISSFNGDPNNTTIFGVSAGGASVQFQLLCSSNKGLFQKAIVQSGSVFDPWAWGQRNVLQVAEKLGLNAANEKEALKVLMEAKTEELLSAAYEISDDLLTVSKRRPFGPIIEKPNSTAFLTEDPKVLIASGRYNQVPLIQGICSNEGHLMELMHVLNSAITFNKEGSLVPWHLQAKGKGTTWAEKVKNYYYQNQDPEAEHTHLSDVGFVAGTIYSMKLLLGSISQPVYFYLFDYETDCIKAFKKGIKLDGSPGVGHGQDNCYIFSTKMFAGPSPPLTDEDKRAIKTMVKIWTDFAKNGNPLSLWEPLEKGKELRYLKIDRELKMQEGLFPERVRFWEQLYEEAGGVDLFAHENGGS